MSSNKKMTIGTRIISGFIFCIILLTIIALIGYYTMNNIHLLVEIIKVSDDINIFIVEREVDHLTWLQNLDLYLISDMEFTGQLDYKKCEFGEWLYSEETQAIEDRELKKLLTTIETPHKNLHLSASEILKTIDKTDKTNIYNKKTISALQDIRKNMRLIRDRFKQLSIEKAGKAAENLSKSTKTSSISILTVGIFAIFAAVALSAIITKSITTVLRKIISNLSNSSNQMVFASTHLSQSSQLIASNATEQVSSIEETTASMEQVSDMVSQNVENTTKVNLLSKSAAEISKTGYTQMESMLQSMNEINSSSEKIKNVMKVINDIAFQTNILALNAAVEAARAGEAGRGFAVVADQVKSLAQKSAEAAKETETIIDESIRKSQNGLKTAQNLGMAFKEILSNIEKVSDMSIKVESSSKQQDMGIIQIKKTMIQFDQIVQSNASSAEETASSAEELLSQVELLNGVVTELLLLVSNKQKSNTDNVKTSTKVQSKINR